MINDTRKPSQVLGFLAVHLCVPSCAALAALLHVIRRQRRLHHRLNRVIHCDCADGRRAGRRPALQCMHFRPPVKHEARAGQGGIHVPHTTTRISLRPRLRPPADPKALGSTHPERKEARPSMSYKVPCNSSSPGPNTLCGTRVTTVQAGAGQQPTSSVCKQAHRQLGHEAFLLSHPARHSPQKVWPARPEVQCFRSGLFLTGHTCRRAVPRHS